MKDHRREYVHRLRVTFADTNLVGNVYFARYVDWQGSCREHFLLDHAPSVIRDLSHGVLALVTLRLEIDYLDECFAGDEIEVGMRVASPPTGNRVSMAFEYRRGDAIVAAGAQSVASFVREGGRYAPCPFPPELADALARFTG